ncbi:leucine-rich repeat extensin-like protein 3 [Iris pallida]|uniref:Leucine-rich repeat extensin-like protein 3 n=1 Tax=Iris pallida TaxID=29817 RepID=A0AAX6DI73_IRIPA|nr:leucine-rich repeat extensin-like protein 3 [Iris pallida]
MEKMRQWRRVRPGTEEGARAHGDQRWSALWRIYYGLGEGCSPDAAMEPGTTRGQVDAMVGRVYEGKWCRAWLGGRPGSTEKGLLRRRCSPGCERMLAETRPPLAAVRGALAGIPSFEGSTGEFGGSFRSRMQGWSSAMVWMVWCLGDYGRSIEGGHGVGLLSAGFGGGDFLWGWDFREGVQVR